MKEIAPEEELQLARELVHKQLMRIGAHKLSQKLMIHWNTRLRSTAGRAMLKSLRIELNPYLLSLPDARSQIQRTALHEAAHLLVHIRYPNKRIQAHGYEWQIACNDLGIPGESATHRLPLPTHKQVRRYHYQCPSCKEIYKRARPIKRPSACASCCNAHAGGNFDKRFQLEPILET